jgi:hypothetical protein
LTHIRRFVSQENESLCLFDPSLSDFLPVDEDRPASLFAQILPGLMRAGNPASISRPPEGVSKSLGDIADLSI